MVKAGLVPALRHGAVDGSESWLVTEMTPGTDPFGQLRTALDRVATATLPDVVDAFISSSRTLDEVVRGVVPRGTTVIFVIDQFEELFTHTVDDGARRAFVQMLVDTAGRPDAVVRLVVTVRADFLDRPLAYAGFADAIQGRTIALGALSADEMAEAVAQPAAGVGVEVEPALVDRITADAEQAPGALPLVQHQMAELFAQRTTNVITLAAYEESGGLAGAIGRRAEAIYLELDDRARSAAREVFVRLVSVDEEHDDTRRRVRRTELECSEVGTDELDIVLREYGRHRLLTFDRDAATRTPTVEVAHEALLSDWPRFKNWIDEARDDLLGRRRIESAAHEWIAAGSDASFLFTGGRLELAESWAAESAFELTADEQQFLSASRTRVDRDRSARARRRRRIIEALAAVAVVTALVATYAIVQRSAADREARATRARELAGHAVAAIPDDPERAIMLALAASEETSEPLPEPVSALQAATQSMRLVTKVDGVAFESVEYDLNGTMVAVDRGAGQSGVVLIDPANGEVLADVDTDRPTGWMGLAFDPGGAELAVGYTGSAGESAIGRFEIPSGRAGRGFSGPSGSYGQVSYHPDGRWVGAVRLADNGRDQEIIVWSVDSPAVPIPLGPGTGFSFVPGTTTVVIAGGDDQGSLGILDLQTGDVVRSIETPGMEAYSVVADPTAHRLALLPAQGARVVVLDLDSGEEIGAFDVTGSQSAEFSPDGRWLAMGSFDNLVHLFDTETLTETLLAGSPSQVGQVSFAPDSTGLASISAGQLRIWELAPEGPPALGGFHASGGVGDLAVGEGESAAAAITVDDADDSASVERIDLATGEAVKVADRLHYVPFNMGPQISADLRVAAGLDDEYRTQVIDLDTGTDVELERCENVRALDRTGRWALIDGSALCDATLGQAVLPGPAVNSRVLDLRTGRTVLDLGIEDMWSAVFGPPAAGGLPGLVAVLNNDNAVRFYGLPSGDLLGSYPSSDGKPMAAAFTADGTRLAVTKDTGRLAVIDVARLADDPADAEVGTAAAHTGSVMNVVTSVSGLIATADFAGSVRVWSQDGTLVADLPVQLEDGAALAFAPGTDTLYYEDAGGAIRRFTPDIDQLTELARSLLTREFTDDECARYFPDEECPTFAD